MHPSTIEAFDDELEKIAGFWGKLHAGALAAGIAASGGVSARNMSHYVHANPGMKGGDVFHAVALQAGAHQLPKHWAPGTRFGVK